MIAQATDKLISDQEQRHSWIFEAAEQIRRWSREDQSKREAGVANNAPASNS